MKEIIEYIKNFFSSLFKKAKTQDDAVLKRYDLVIFIGVIFIIVYGGFFLMNVEKTAISSKPSVVNIGVIDSSFNTNKVFADVDKMMPPTIIPNNVPLKNTEFFIGEVVGIRYFGLYGIVQEKILGTSGYTYEVMWKNGNSLSTHVFSPWMLFRPEAKTVPPAVLQN